MDRKVFALAARSVGTYNGDVSADRAIGIEAVCAVSAVDTDAGGTTTLDVKFQNQDPASDNFIDIPGASFAQFVATGSQRLIIHPRVAAVANEAVAKAVVKGLRAVAALVTPNEEQTVSITGTPAGGDFTLTYDGQTTAPIAFNADATAVGNALKALSNIGNSDVAVSGANPDFTVTFQGALASTNVPEMTADGSGLTGGTAPDVAIATTVVGGGTVTFGLHLRLIGA